MFCAEKTWSTLPPSSRRCRSACCAHCCSEGGLTVNPAIASTSILPPYINERYAHKILGLLATYSFRICYLHQKIIKNSRCAPNLKNQGQGLRTKGRIFFVTIWSFSALSTEETKGCRGSSW